MKRSTRAVISAAIALLVVLASYMVWRAAQEDTTIQVGLLPITDAAQAFIAQDLGLFTDEDLVVELVPMRGGAATLPALGSGSVDVAFSNTLSAVLYDENVSPLVALSGGALLDESHSESGVLVDAGSGITDLAGLRGKKVAVNVKFNILHLALRRALRKQGVTPDQYEVAEVPFPQMEGALRANRVDAILAPEPFLTSTEAAGGVVNLGDIYVSAFGRVHLVGYFTTRDLYEEQRAQYEGFNRAIEAATPIANSYGGEALAAIQEFTGVELSVLKAAGRPLFVERLPSEALLQMRQWMEEEDFLGAR